MHSCTVRTRSTRDRLSSLMLPPWKTQPITAATLGPQGTFAEEATLQEIHPQSSVQLVPRIEKIYEKVDRGEVIYGVVPIENSTEGVVTASFDTLMRGHSKVVGEILLRIQHNLLSHSTTLDAIRKVYAHPQALAQCRRWLERNIPGAVLVATSSNAEGVSSASRETNTAAIGSLRAAALYQMPVLRAKIHDQRGNTTRFYVISRSKEGEEQQNVTILKALIPHCPGGLVGLLQPLSRAGINLQSVHSRPSKVKRWGYTFIVIVEANTQERLLAKALEAARKSGVQLRILGGYRKMY